MVSEERPAADPAENVVLGGGGPNWGTAPIIRTPAEKTWVWSDLHLGHAAAVENFGRPFEDVEAMNRHLLGEWRRCVQPDHTIICLGDVADEPRRCRGASSTTPGTTYIFPAASGGQRLRARDPAHVAGVSARMYRFVLWLVPTVEKFPRRQTPAAGRLRTVRRRSARLPRGRIRRSVHPGDDGRHRPSSRSRPRPAGLRPEGQSRPDAEPRRPFSGSACCASGNRGIDPPRRAVRQERGWLVRTCTASRGSQRRTRARLRSGCGT